MRLSAEILVGCSASVNGAISMPEYPIRRMLAQALSNGHCSYTSLQIACLNAAVELTIYSLFATTIIDNPGHGIRPSTRRQNQTVLSKIFSITLLMCLRRSTFPYSHHPGVPILLSW